MCYNQLKMKLFSWIQDLADLNELPTPEATDAADPVSPVLQARMHELEKMSVREVMTPRSLILALDVDVQLRRVRRLKSAKTVYFPVYKGDLDNVIGWISKLKVLELLNEPNDEVPLQQYLRPVGVISEDASAAELADAYLKSASPFLVVKNAQGATVGLVPLSEFVELVFGFDMDIVPSTVPVDVAAPPLRSYEL